MNNEREKEIRQRMERRFANRAEFFSHLVAYVIFNLVIWALFLDIRNPTVNLFGMLGILITGGWTIGIAIHFVQYYFAEMRERAIQREIDRDYYSEKSKRTPYERLVQIDEEGELVEVEESKAKNLKR